MTRLLDNRTLVAVALGGIACAVFVPAATCGFVNWADTAYVVENPLVQRAPAAEALRRAWTDVVMCNWAPLKIASYQFDAVLWSMRPAGFHLTNVLLHGLSTGLLYLVLVLMTAAPLPAVAATLLFSLHPLRVEPVVWISSRKVVLSTFFLLLSSSPGSGIAGGRPRPAACRRSPRRWPACSRNRCSSRCRCSCSCSMSGRSTAAAAPVRPGSPPPRTGIPGDPGRGCSRKSSPS